MRTWLKKFLRTKDAAGPMGAPVPGVAGRETVAGGETLALKARIGELEAKVADLRKLVDVFNAAEAQAHLGSWEWRIGSDTPVWSPELYRLHGLDPRSEEPLVSRIDRTIHPEDFPTFRAQIAEASATGKPFLIRVRVVLADGGIRHLEVRGEGVRDGRGAVERLIGTAFDVTGTKAHERSLIAAREEAEAGSRIKSAFLANVSHEIRTPMTALIGFAELLAAPAAMSEERRRSYAAIIQRNAHHMLSLVTSMIDLARVQAGDLPLTIEEVPVEAMLREALAHLTDEAAVKGVALTAGLAAGSPRSARTDRHRISQIVVQVASNAVRHTDRGEITVTGRVVDDRLEVRFVDTGPGIAPEAMPELFEPFGAAVTRVSSRPRSGVGLGLAVSRGVARLLGGDLTVVRTGTGEGTELLLTVSNRLENDEATRTIDLPGGRSLLVHRSGGIEGLNVWLMTAEAGVSEAVARVLGKFGVHLTVVDDGRKEPVAGDGAPAVLIDDHGTSDSPKIRTRIAGLRDRGYVGRIVVIVPEASIEARRTAMDAGADAVLGRSLDPLQLLRALAPAVGQSMEQAPGQRERR